MKETLPDNPLAKTSATTWGQAASENRQNLSHSYTILPLKEKKSAQDEQQQSSWTFNPDSKFPGWLLASKQGGSINGTVAVYLWGINDSAESAAAAVRNRNDRECSGEKVNIMIEGDPSDERNQALRKALNEAGYEDRYIFFVSEGSLYGFNAEGKLMLLDENYVPSEYRNDPRKQVAYAVLKLKKETGLNGYGVCNNSNEDDYDGDESHEDVKKVSKAAPYPLDDDDRRKQKARYPNHFPTPPPPPPLPVAKTTPSSGYKPVAIPQIGGVMLHQAAKVQAGHDAQVNLISGDFSLIIEGNNAQLDPNTFRRFITALWAVYYSNQDPGISIDPIAPGVDKHMVRYIGKVINTDLGRVMREADYLMKQWAVGTERPDMPGFKNPDDIAAQKGVVNVGIMSRFWFVPEDMSFKRSDDMLLFDNGRMSVKTEYVFNNSTGGQADPANEEFAKFFTDHYQEIARQYPVYKELFEYAKMVSLAKYLKEKGIPLFWFLMANKDLVLTEDSPGTVDALAKGSDYFKNIYIEGGVDLGFQGNYVYDNDAITAIGKALSNLPKTSHTEMPSGYNVKKPVYEPFSFDVQNRSYSVLPQHSLTSGRDRRGIRYQTDIALKDTGFMLTEQSFAELSSDILYAVMAKSTASISGPQSSDQQESLYKEATEKTEKFLMSLQGLKNQKYSDGRAFEKAVGEKIKGQEYAEQLKPLIIKGARYDIILELARYYNPKQQENGEFGKGWHLLIPYKIKPAGNAKKEFINVLVPEQMVVENLVTGQKEILTFSTDRYSIAGYVPEKLQSSQVVGLFIMSDASYRLADKLGNEFWFDQTGYLTDMVFSEQHRIHFEYQRGLTNAFERAPYGIKPVGEDRVKFANATIPKAMVIDDMVNGSSETLVFSESGEIAGYVPQNKEKSRYEILALMSDASFQLLDKKGNEVAFGPDGKFEWFAASPDCPIVKSVSSGPYKVNFEYTLDRSGNALADSIHLLCEGGTKVLYAIGYNYDAEGRLSHIKELKTDAVKPDRLSDAHIAAAGVEETVW
ncbi:MAG: hypothetical protein WC454_03045 [Phycisphaerae bacterium]